MSEEYKNLLTICITITICFVSLVGGCNIAYEANLKNNIDVARIQNCK